MDAGSRVEREMTCKMEKSWDFDRSLPVTQEKKIGTERTSMDCRDGTSFFDPSHSDHFPLDLCFENLCMVGEQDIHFCLVGS